jgi:outer membrane protein, heavy metal efflux system
MQFEPAAFESTDQPPSAQPASAQPPSDDAGPPLTLDEAIATGLAESPTLIALRAGDPVAVAALGVAKTYPFNPYVQVEVTPYVEEINGTPGAVLNYVLLMQTLELAHQQSCREASAAALLQQVRWNIVAAELLYVATTERLFFTALYQRGLRDLAEQTAALNEQLLGVVQRRVKANVVGLAGAETMAEVTARQSREQATLAEDNYQVALLALRRQLNLPANRPFALAPHLENFEWRPIDGVSGQYAERWADIPVPAELAENLADRRPDVLAAQSASNAAEANAGLARANIVQNLQIGPYYERDDYGTLFVGFRAQMNIPVWDSGRPLARQREAEASQQVVTASQLQSRARVEVETAIKRYERARRLALARPAVQPGVVPAELIRIKEQFEGGQADILNVYATQTSLLQEWRTRLDLLNELALAGSDVTLSTGLPPSRLVSGPPAPVMLSPVPPPAP